VSRRASILEDLFGLSTRIPLVGAAAIAAAMPTGRHLFSLLAATPRG